MFKFLIILISAFFLTTANAEEKVFNSAFGVKFGQPYDKFQHTGNKINITPPITATNIFDDYAIVLNSENLVEGIFAKGFAIGKKQSCQESMFGLAEKFYLKYKNSFKKEQTAFSFDFSNKDYIVSFMCYENTLIFSAIKQ